VLAGAVEIVALEKIARRAILRPAVRSTRPEVSPVLALRGVWARIESSR